MISLFVEKENEQATLTLYRILDAIDFPEDVGITINNMRDAKSGVLREDGKVVDISLANCYTLEDVVRELVGLVAYGYSREEILEAYPYLEADDIQEALAYAAWRAEEIEIPFAA